MSVGVVSSAVYLARSGHVVSGLKERKGFKESEDGGQRQALCHVGYERLQQSTAPRYLPLRFRVFYIIPPLHPFTACIFALQFPR